MLSSKNITSAILKTLFTSHSNLSLLRDFMSSSRPLSLDRIKIDLAWCDVWHKNRCNPHPDAYCIVWVNFNASKDSKCFKVIGWYLVDSITTWLGPSVIIAIYLLRRGSRVIQCTSFVLAPVIPTNVHREVKIRSIAKFSRVACPLRNSVVVLPLSVRSIHSQSKWLPPPKSASTAFSGFSSWFSFRGGSHASAFPSTPSLASSPHVARVSTESPTRS